MGDQTGDQADAEFQDKGLWRVDHIYRVKQIADGHADGAADSPVYAAKQQRAENADRISKVDGGGVAARQGDLDLQKGEYYIRECGKNAGKYDF